ncbi:MAG: O-antigen ligase family protein [Candidatus Lernaella stagnicola]|nr:O-antigen ligase family protein [Candidatus Lernaella stagnicola]
MSESRAAYPPPRPWHLHALLGVVFAGDALVWQVIYFGTGATIRIGWISFLAIVVLVALLALRRDFARLDRRVLFLQGLLVLYALTGLCVAFFRTGEVTGYALWKTTGLLIKGVAGIWVMHQMMRTWTDLRRAIVVLLLFGLWVCLPSLPEIAAGDLHKVIYFHKEIWPRGVLGMPLLNGFHLSNRLSPLILMPIFVLLHRDRFPLPRWLSGLLALAAIMLFPLIVFLSGSRTDLAAMVGVIVFWQVRQGRLRRLALVALLAAIVLVGFSLAGTGDSQALERAETLMSVQSVLGDKSFAERLTAWRASTNIFLEHPFFGVGFGEFGYFLGYGRGARIYPHNIFFEYVVDIGLLGPIIAALLVTLPFAVFWRRNDDLSLVFVGFFLAAFVTANFTGDAVNFHRLYMAAGLIPLLANPPPDEP